MGTFICHCVQGDIASDLLSDMDVNKIDNLLWLWELAPYEQPCVRDPMTSKINKLCSGQKTHCCLIVYYKWYFPQ